MKRRPAAPIDDAAELNELLLEGFAPAELPAADRNSVRGRLLARIGASAARHAGLLTIRAQDGVWRAVKAGVDAKTLWEGPAGASVLIRFAAGAHLPVHRHLQLEEGIVLSGRLQVEDLDLGPGDYHVSPPGSRHGRIGSRDGGLAYLRGTSLGHPAAVLGELLGALVPGDGPPIHTVVADERGWESLADGVEQKLLWREGEHVSRFVRLAPGGCLPPHRHDGDEECIMVSGEVFIGDILVRAGEYHLAPAGSMHAQTVSDCGGLAYVRGRVSPVPPAG